MIKSFEELIEKARVLENKKVAIVSSLSEHTVKSGILAKENDIAEPVFIGDKRKIEEILKKLGKEPSDYIIEDSKSEEESALRAVELAKKGEVDIILKGNISTSTLMKKILAKESGLRTGNLLSDVFITEDTSKDYPKLIGMSDGGINILPSLEEKKAIIDNAVKVFKRLGYEKPKVAVLSCVEYVNEKIPSTVEAKKLQEMNERGEIKDCIVEGPLALDLAVSEFAAKLKGVEGKVVGNADILIVPNIEAGNIFGKSFTYFTHLKVGHIIVGAKIPILIPSRAETEEDRLNSIAIAVFMENLFE